MFCAISCEWAFFYICEEIESFYPFFVVFCATCFDLIRATLQRTHLDDILRFVRGHYDNAVSVANFQCRRVFDGVHHGKKSALVDYVVFRNYSDISNSIYSLTRISSKLPDNRREFAAITRCPGWQSSWSQAQRRAERIFSHNFSISRRSVGHVLGYFSEATQNISVFTFGSQFCIITQKKNQI